jgi:hypothetical protein
MGASTAKDGPRRKEFWRFPSDRMDQVGHLSAARVDKYELSEQSRHHRSLHSFTAHIHPMNSPCIIVSQYRSDNRRMSMSTTQVPTHCPIPYLLSAAWQPSIKYPQVTAPNDATTTSLDDINDFMGNYWSLVFEFTYPSAIDFRDLRSGELASTQSSLMVFEYGQKLWSILGSLQNMRVAPNATVALERFTKNVKGSLEDLRFWIEDQRMQQLLDEVAESPN